MLGLLVGGHTGAAAGDTGAPPDLDWLAGHWCGQSGGTLIEELWLPAKGGLMLGVGRTTRGERTVNFEFMRILHENGDTHFIAQPQGAPPTSFRLTAAGDDWARFENQAHDFPQAVEYRRSGDNLHAEVAGGGRTIAFRYTACESAVLPIVLSCQRRASNQHSCALSANPNDPSASH